MTPRFSQYVDPLFAHVLDLLEQIDAGQQPLPEEQKRIINDQIRTAEYELARTNSKAWDLAKYALVSWIDELLLNCNQWSGREWWLANMLEWEHFKSAECHQYFYVRAKDAANLPGAEDALETYYVCAMLGFRGLYGENAMGTDSESRTLAIRQFDLSPDLSTWVHGLATIIRQRRMGKSTEGETGVRERRVLTAQPLWGRARLLWPWLLAALIAGLDTVLVFFQ